MHLTNQEIEQFHQLGYVVKPAVFSQAAMQPIKEAIDEMVDRKARQLHADGKLADICADAPFETRLANIQTVDKAAAQAIVGYIWGKGGGGYSGPAMLAMLRHEPLLGCVASLIGEDIVGSSVYRIRPKMPLWERGEVPWHQDSGYFLPHCDTHLIVTCWVPLVDATLDNGCLWVLPKSHQRGIITHHRGGHGGYLEIIDPDLPPVEPIPVPMSAGSVLFMTNLTPHASFENHTDQVRWSLDLRYQSMSAPNNLDEAPTDVTPERDPVTMACYPPEADFVIRDTHHPEREIRSPDAFNQLRERFNSAKVYSPGRGWKAIQEG
jgi:hypothetical protein